MLTAWKCLGFFPESKTIEAKRENTDGCVEVHYEKIRRDV